MCESCNCLLHSLCRQHFFRSWSVSLLFYHKAYLPAEFLTHSPANFSSVRSALCKPYSATISISIKPAITATFIASILLTFLQTLSAAVF